MALGFSLLSFRPAEVALLNIAVEPPSARGLDGDSTRNQLLRRDDPCHQTGTQVPHPSEVKNGDDIDMVCGPEPKWFEMMSNSSAEPR
jgi:hypothetical protein